MSEAVKDEIGSAVLFEDDRVKIWDLQIEPGQGHGMHRHSNDYILVFVGDCRLRGINADGSTRFEQDMHHGQVVHRTLEGDEDVHDALNVGDTPSRNLIIELKK